MARTPKAQGSDSDPTSQLSFSQLVFSDYERHVEWGDGARRPSWPRILVRLPAEPGMVASIIVRAQQCLFRAGHVRAAWYLRTLGMTLVAADLVPGATIGTGLYLPHPTGLVIGKHVQIGNNVTLAQGVTLGVRENDRTVTEQALPVICDGANVWGHSMVLGGVRVGKGAEIGANSVVLEDVPDYTIVAGAPAREVGKVKHPGARADAEHSPAP